MNFKRESENLPPFTFEFDTFVARRLFFFIIDASRCGLFIVKGRRG